MDLFNLFAKITLDDSEFNESIKDAEESGESFASKFQQAIETVKKVLIGAGIVKSIQKINKAFSNALNQTTDYADAVDKGSQRLGISTKAYQELNYALGMSGAGIDDLSIAVRNLNSIMAGGAADDLSEAFESLGINTIDANGDLRETSDVLKDVLLALADMEQTAERSDIATKIFGRGAQTLNAFFNTGKEGIQDLLDEAEELGLVMSEDAVKQGASTKDSMDRLHQVLDKLVMDIMEPFLPVVQDVVDLLTPLLPPLSKAIQSVAGFLKSLLVKLGVIVDEEDVVAKAANIEVGKSVYNNLSRSTDYYQQFLNKYDDATAGNLMNLLKMAFEASNYGGSDPEHVSELWDDFYEALGAAEQELVSPAESTSASLDNLESAAETAAAALSGFAYSVPGMTAEESSGNIGSFASGQWDVPYDDFPALLHEGEMVLTKSQANDYRNGEGIGNSAAIVSAIQRLETTMANLQLVVGGKEFGRATVRYGGYRMDDYIGGMDSKLAAGYGS